jgi:hypothetical protein
VQLSRSKTTVISYVVLAFFGVAASWISWYSGHFRLEYSAPGVVATLLLFWIRINRAYYAQPFYKNAWRLNTLFLWLSLIPAVLLKFAHMLPDV